MYTTRRARANKSEPLTYKGKVERAVQSTIESSTRTRRSGSGARQKAPELAQGVRLFLYARTHKMPLFRLRPNLYRSVRVVMSDGSTYRQPSAVRMVGGLLALERDAANHPVYLGLNDLSGMVDRREEMRLQKIAQRRAKREGGEDEDEV